MKKILLIGILFVAGLVCAKAQDVIVKANGDRVFAKILEVGDDVVKYKDYNNQNGPDYTIKTSDFEKITLANGDVIKGKPANTSVVTVTPTAASAPARKKVNPEGYLNGFVSANIGLSSLTKNYSDVKTGYEPELMLGYLFTRIVGIAAGGWLNSHPLTSYNASLGTYGFYAGPMFAIPTSLQRVVDIDIIPYIGLAHLRASGDLSVRYNKFHVIGGLTIQARWNLHEKFALIARSGQRIIGEMPEGDNNYSSGHTSIGIALRF